MVASYIFYYHVYFEQEAGDVDPEPEDPAVTPGYRFATSADVTAENGGTAVVHVKITGHSDENVTSYNAYDLTLVRDLYNAKYGTFDSVNMEKYLLADVNGDRRMDIRDVVWIAWKIWESEDERA